MLNILTTTAAAPVCLEAVMAAASRSALPGGTLNTANARIPMTLREITLPDGTVVTLN